MKVEFCDGENDKYQTSSKFIYHGEKYSYYGRGLTRIVFANEARTKVIKMPRGDDSDDYNYLCNRIEDAVYNQLLTEKEKEEYAECKLIKNGWLLMEFIEARRGSQGKSKGMSGDQKLKYFDYADYDYVERLEKECNFNQFEDIE